MEEPARRGLRRLGLVSGDFRTHPVGRLLLPILPAIKNLGIEIFCYSTRPGLAGDPLPAQFISHATVWRDIERVPDLDVARKIREDGIDCLIDLSGHTSHNRLGVFAHQPAPWQGTWLGYGGTTGLSRIQFAISDVVSSPEGEDRWFTEQLVRLPMPRLPMPRPEGAPEIARAPASRAGTVTFGCFNNIAKVNSVVLSTWARILHSVPGSRLLLKGRHFNYGRPKAALCEAMSKLGIGTDRVVFEGFSSGLGYWDAFSKIDIMLDPFPFSGGMSSLDALWMGVPLVTLGSGGMFGRQGAMLLSALGLDNWCASSIDEYVRLATVAAHDVVTLDRLRSEMRDRWSGTSASNPGAYAVQLIDGIQSSIEKSSH